MTWDPYGAPAPPGSAECYVDHRHAAPKRGDGPPPICDACRKLIAEARERDAAR